MPARPRSITSFQLDPDQPPVLTAEQQARLEATPIDYSDIPELPDHFWTDHPPATRQPKQQITLRVDRDVIEFFRDQGPSYQTRINTVLRTYVEAMRQRGTTQGVGRVDQRTGRTTRKSGRKAAKASQPKKQRKAHTVRRHEPQH